MLLLGIRRDQVRREFTLHVLCMQIFRPLHLYERADPLLFLLDLRVLHRCVLVVAVRLLLVVHHRRIHQFLVAQAAPELLQGILLLLRAN